MSKITLRDVEATLRNRLASEPLKVYWREVHNDMSNQNVCNGFEARYLGLTPEKVKKAMQGIPQVEKRRFKDRAYSWMLRWEHKSSEIQFRCTLYVYENGDCHFIFTNSW